MVNQQLQPSGFSDAGIAWHVVSADFVVTGTTLAVQLANASSGLLIADAVRIERLAAAPLHTLPAGPHATAEDVALVFSTATGKRISISDEDALDTQLQTTLTVPTGTLSVAPSPIVTGNGTNNLTLTGTLSALNAALDGLTYVPLPDAFGAVTLSITTSDLGRTGHGPGLTDTDQLTINVWEVNDAPTAVADVWTDQLEDSGPWLIPLSGFVTANDVRGPANESAQQLSVIAISNVVGGTAVVEQDKIRFTPTAHFTGAASFTYSLQDNGITNGQPDFKTSPASVSFTVLAVNDAPVLNNAGSPFVGAVGEDAAFNPGTVVSTLLSTGAGGTFTDSDGPNRGIAVTAVNNANGQWQFSLNGTSWENFGTPLVTNARLLDQTARVRFVPNANFAGVISNGLTFVAWDQSSGINGSTADTASAGGSTAFSIAVETASMEVLPVNDPPSIIDTPPSVFLAENGAYGPYTFYVTDSETPAYLLQVTAVSSNTTLVPQGNIALSGIGSTRTIAVFLAPDESGVATITLTVSDSDGGSTTANFTLTVNPQNTPPVAYEQDVGMARNTSKQIVLAGDDGDAGFTQALTYFVPPSPAHGTLSNFNAATGTLTYTPHPGYFGTDSFWFYVRDDATIDGAALDSPWALVSIIIAENNQPPELELLDRNGQALGDPTVVEGSALVFRARATDPDAGDTHSYALDWRGTNGQLVAAPGNVTFDSATGVFLWAPDESQGPGVYTAVVHVTDHAATPLTDSHTIRITVGEHNLRPTIYGPGWPWWSNPRAVQVAFSDPNDPPQEVRFLVGGWDNDFPGQDLTYELVSGPGEIVDAQTGEYLWTVPASTPVQTVDVTFRVRDNGSPQRTHDVVVPIAVIRYDQTPSYAPVANADTWSVQHGETLTGVNILNNDSWASAAPDISFTTPSHGSLSIDPAGNVTYIAPNNYAGPVTFSYTLTDPHPGGPSLSHTTAVLLHVLNNEPAARDLDYYAAEGEPLVVSAADGILEDYTIVDGDATTVTLVMPPAHGTLNFNSDGSFNYTPNAGFSGEDSLVYKINETAAGLVKYFEDMEAHFHDDRGEHGIVRFHVAPAPPNSPPTANNDDYTIPFAAGSLAVNAVDGVLANDFDPDDTIEELAALLVAGTPEGQVNLNPDGSFTFTPNATFDGHATFHYKLSDGQSFSNVATVTVKEPGTGALADVDVDSDNSGEIDGTPEEEAIEESNPGKFVVLNADDDDGNGVVDSADPTPLTQDDLDLQPINLAILNPNGADLTGFEVAIIVPLGETRFKLWTTRDKQSQIEPFPKTYAVEMLPSTIYLEGISPGEIKIDLKLKEPTGNEVHRDTVTLRVVTPPNMTVYRPQTESYGNPFQRTAVPDMEELSPGAGIRRNGDDDNNNESPDYLDTTVAGENDLIEIYITTPLPTLGLIYVLRRNDEALQVWTGPDKTTPVFDPNTVTPTYIEPISGTSHQLWVEWNDVAADFTGRLDVLLYDTQNDQLLDIGDSIGFYPFETLVIMLGGFTQSPIDPAQPGEGIFDYAISEYQAGYDVHMYAHTEVNALTGGQGRAYDEIVSAINERGVKHVFITGFSLGGGALFHLTSRLYRNYLPESDPDHLGDITTGSFVDLSTAYIDAVNKIDAPLSEARRPLGSFYHMNFYELNSGPPHGNAVIDPRPGDFEVNV